MKQFEYQVVKVQNHKDGADPFVVHVAGLNQAGDQGWEVVAFYGTSSDGEHAFLVKREKMKIQLASGADVSSLKIRT